MGNNGSIGSGGYSSSNTRCKGYYNTPSYSDSCCTAQERIDAICSGGSDNKTRSE